jgi:hypothetical protein
MWCICLFQLICISQHFLLLVETGLDVCVSQTSLVSGLLRSLVLRLSSANVINGRPLQLANPISKRNKQKNRRKLFGARVLCFRLVALSDYLVSPIHPLHLYDVYHHMVVLESSYRCTFMYDGYHHTDTLIT